LFDIEYYKSIRKKLHTIPELGYEEYKTSSFILGELDRLGIRYEKGIAKTGIIAWIKKGKSHKSIALRADMDALPLLEDNNFEYKSTHQNCSHACGHDGHMVMLLGAIDYLKNRIDFDGTVYFIFQPAEEGGAGAKAMIDEGLLKHYKIDKIFGLHNRPTGEFGKFYIKKGAVMSSIDTFEIKIEGKSSHSSMPHTSLNPIVIASHIVLAIKSISSLNIDPNSPSVISVTQIISGDAVNITPKDCIIKGSIRTYDKKIQEIIKKRMTQIVTSIAESFDSRAVLNYYDLYPATINSDIDSSIESATKTVGKDGVVTDYISSFASEDFSFFLEQKRGSFIWLGTQKTNTKAIPLHSQDYDFNDDAIILGVRYWVNLVGIELSLSISQR
jgi:hippurate hydrolase